MRSRKARNLVAGGVFMLAVLAMVAAVLWPTGGSRVSLSGRTASLASAERTPSFSLHIRVSTVDGVDPIVMECPAVGTCYLTGNPPVGDSPAAAKTVGMLVTHNGGKTWRHHGPDLSTTLTCVSAEVCAGSGGTVGHSTFIRTVNGGKTWTYRSMPGKYGVAMSCTTAEDCVAMSSFTGKAELTTNAGRTWRNTPLPSGLKKFQAFGVQCFTSGHCVAIGNILNDAPNRAAHTSKEGLVGPTYALYSTDGGLKWHKGTIPTHFNIGTNLSCGTAMDCIALGTDGRSPGIATSDGGRKWHAVTDPGGSVSKGGYWWVSCVGSSECWMLAAGDHGNTLGLLESTDLGHSWRLLKAPKAISSGTTIACATTTRCYATASPPSSPTSGSTTTTIAPTAQGDNLFLSWRVPK